MIPRWELTPPCPNRWIIVSISRIRDWFMAIPFELPLFVKSNTHTDFVGVERAVVVGTWG
jgi:hypothetical protein